MTPSDRPQLSITGPETADGTVSSDVLIRMLNGLQQLALIVAAAEQGRTIQQRFKPSEELRQQFTLRCGVPHAGSYTLPVMLEDVREQPGIVPSRTLDSVYMFLLATSRGDEIASRNCIADSRWRNRALREIRAFAPRRGERWSASFEMPDKDPLSLNGQLARNAERWLAVDVPEEATLTVTGELIRISFDEYKLFIRYPVNRKELECSYLPDIESDLVESRRGQIQVTGNYVLDDDGNPLRLTEVTRIEPVDLSPFVLDHFESDALSLKARHPITFVPFLDEDTQQLYVVRDTALDLHVFAYTRDALVDEISEGVLFAWLTYAEEREGALSPRAMELRRTLLARFEELRSNASKQESR